MSEGIEVVEATVDDWARVKDVRLRALADAPEAFARRLEDERERAPSEWRARLENPDAATFLAVADGATVGMAGVFVAADDDTLRNSSRCGLPRSSGEAGREGRSVKPSSIGHAPRDLPVELWVTETSLPARSLYEGLGFSASGEEQPLPSDPRLNVVQMVRSGSG
ncbi:MAG TPA: hypothetical protein VE032_03015 [Actinomycetota bacterium]|nr:hypothetical protein [Actinomycetota bacterium]